jgi:hypothetical protein
MKPDLIKELLLLTSEINSKNKRVHEILLLLNSTDASSQTKTNVVKKEESKQVVVIKPKEKEVQKKTVTTAVKPTLTFKNKESIVYKTEEKVNIPIPKEVNIFMLFGILGVVIAFLAIYVLGKAYIGVIPDIAKALFVYVLATILLTLSFKLNKRGKELFYGLGQSFYLFAIMIGYIYYHLTTPLTSFVLIVIWLLAFNLLEMKYKPLFINLLVTQVASLFLILYLSYESLLFAGIYSLILIVFNKYRIKNIENDKQKLLLHAASYFNLLLVVFRIIILF